MKIGWIGAGRMGAPMALKAALAGHEITIFAAEIKQETALREAGVRIATTAAEAVREAELICLCLFSDEQARSVMLGDDGALRSVPPGAIVAIHVSGSPKLAQDLADAAPPGVCILDAPFSGQEAGMLTLLVGGEKSAFEASRNVFAAYASRITLVGPLGSAQRVKLVNQFLYRANVAAADAALRILEGRGLSRKDIVPALLSCSGASWALGTLVQGPPMAERVRSFQPYLDVYLAAAREDGLPIESLLQRGEPEPDDGC